jgi:hypothetical protein
VNGEFRVKVAILGLAAVLVLSSQAYSRTRLPFEDHVVVERSDLIVAGFLRESSITYVPHQNRAGLVESWEHHASVVVTEVIKGQTHEKEIPIVIHYGLAPKVGGKFLCPGYGMSTSTKGWLDTISRKYGILEPVEIWDTGSSAFGSKPVVADAGGVNLWFLRKLPSLWGQNGGRRNFGVTDPEDIQPFEFKNYFLAYLSKGPEKAVKEQLKKNPNVAKRAQRYLNHLEIERIAKIPDVNDRVGKLLPYYVRNIRWQGKNEAREAIIACGEIAGPYLRTAYDDPNLAHVRRDIIRVWGATKYRGCVPLLIELLKECDNFWAGQKLTNDWWNNDPDPQRKIRRAAYEKVCYSVIALREINDSRAKDAIELTKRRWASINFDNPQILDECNRALRQFSGEIRR